MWAVVFEKHGRLEILEHRELPKPTPSFREVLIKIKASAIMLLSQLLGKRSLISIRRLAK